MPKFVVEREIPGAGQWTADQMRQASDADLIRRHASMGGFPANRIVEVRAGLDPISAER